jgi:hypothetical protein
MFSYHAVTADPAVQACARRRATAAQGRREKIWAWLTLATLVLCWDASMRLDERVSPPRPRIAHAGEAAEIEAQPIRTR